MAELPTHERTCAFIASLVKRCKGCYRQGVSCKGCPCEGAEGLLEAIKREQPTRKRGERNLRPGRSKKGWSGSDSQ